MNTTVNGIGGISAGYAGANVTVRSNSKAKTGQTGKISTSKGKKQLNYNSKEISSQLMRASKSRNAAQVLTRAKSKVNSLQRCLGTGQYNDNEVRSAIIHAKRMVKCAQMKVRNLREEEQIGKNNDREHSEKELRQKSEVKRRVSRKEKELKTKVMLEETQQVIKEKSMRQELLRKRRLHRNQERSKISEADMKYLKDKMNERGSSYSGDSGVAIELSSAAAGLSELQLSEHALELLENQVEMEVEIEMEIGGADFSGEMSAMSGTGDAAVTDSGAAAATGMTVDVSV